MLNFRILVPALRSLTQKQTPAFHKRMNTFENDFTKDLEKAARSGTADISVLHKWNPSKVAPPEIHIACGIAAQVPFEAMNYQLRRSPTFQQMNNVLNLSLSESLLTSISKQPVSDEKVQVWLFARYWFTTYITYLLDPLTQKTAFYKERHDEFLGLMRHLLEMQQTRRLTFRSALSAWFPESELFTKEDQTEDDDESDDESHHAVQPVHPPKETTVHPVLPVPLQPTAGRLVLKGWGGPVARSKTRKSLRN